MKSVIWLLVAMLVILHQDFWNWTNGTLMYGFMPTGLFYHVCLSGAAAFVWLLAVTFAWPEGIDDFEDHPVEDGGEA